MSTSEKRPAGLNFQNPKDLLLSVPLVVKNRTGSVLSRGMILKSDHFDAGYNQKADIKLQGAPNFRMADANVFGVAQSTVTGVQTVLTLLKMGPNKCNDTMPAALWISTREEPLIYLNSTPFVIRDAQNPFKNIQTFQGIRVNRLEQMEERLKNDILAELARWNGLILVHDEVVDGGMEPNWLAATTIQTPREVFLELKELGYNVDYERIPITSEEAPTDMHMQRFTDQIGKRPLIAPLIFNCGMGLGRTTCAMVIALIIRRFKNYTETGVDLFKLSSIEKSRFINSNEKTVQLLQILDEAFADFNGNRSAIEWAMARTPVLGHLQESMEGNYHVVSQLCSLLSNGDFAKMVADEAIDRCGLLVNLRQTILVHRLRYSLTGDDKMLETAVNSLERYLSILVLSSYMQDRQTRDEKLISFSEWLIQKEDVFNLLKRLEEKSASLSFFKPCDNISVFSNNIDRGCLAAWGALANQPAKELDQFVIKARKGSVLVQNTILKEDFWVKESQALVEIKGAANFRQIPGYSVYGVAQPTLQGVKNVIEVVGQMKKHIVWINLREEPFLYLNGVPYVLRDVHVTLRNLNSYQGITSQGLEIIEMKLKKDVIAELEKYEGRILLHSEQEDGTVVPIWEECLPDTILSLKDAMNLIKVEMGAGGDIDVNESRMNLHVNAEFRLLYYRVPFTAELVPEDTDFDSLINIIKGINLDDTAVVLNCQIGHGRSTTGTVMTVLIMRWLGLSDVVPMSAKKRLSTSATNHYNYQVIHALLRVIRNGIECKTTVDQVIDSAAAIINIRDGIEYFRQKYETETDSKMKARFQKRGIVSLERYFTLILFQSYLDQNPPGLESELITFKNWKKMHPEFATIKEEFLYNAENPLIPVTEMEPGDGIAMTDEVLTVVNRRRGPVLSQGTIVKYDVFPGCQKLTLKDRINGGHNYRLININEIFTDGNSTELNLPTSEIIATCMVAGVGMPSKSGIRSVLEVLDAGQLGSKIAYWTSLREEPVIYIKGLPYVLRLFIEPIRNLVTTGIARERVEMMEIQMKKDLLNDMKAYGNRILLHEERVEDSKFLVVPVWVSVLPEEIETPLEVYTSILNEGYKVNYLRIPITDELSPIPDVFDEMVQRTLEVPNNGIPIFNCQMGRGRTTQGLIITCLLKIIVGNIKLQDSPDKYIPIDEPQFNLASTSTESMVDATYVRTLKAGNYNIILKLIGVLQFGKLAKYLTDLVIDSCDHLQNLRTAIFEFKLRLSAMQSGTRKYEYTYEMGCNYLVRYFYLIAFADYLIEIWSNLDQEKLKFGDWLSQRKEIQNIVKFPNMDA